AQARPAKPGAAARRAQLPALAELRAAADDLVVVHGEANAWSVRVADRPAPEIVHWLAWRPATGETFSAVIAPRARLAPSVPLQIKLPIETLAAGESWESFRARWAAFVRPSDAVCSWGHFPTATLMGEGVDLPARRFDARVAASGLLGARVGTAEECARRLEEAETLSLGREREPDGSDPLSLLRERVGVRGPDFSDAPGRGAVRMRALARVVMALLSSGGA
ncbi:MAG TPA: hypothetical protein VHJ20_14405, partial [Polyangia bacterium]|nr:hypothetical protein [Polyangia bacterium]